jgi:hypothetical protein
VTAQVSQTGTHTVGAGRPGAGAYTTYQVRLVLDDALAANVYTIYGDSGHEMELPPAYQASRPLGANIGGVNPAFFATRIAGAADAQYDSWLTVGETAGNAHGGVSSIGIPFDAWTLGEGLVVSDGAVFWMDPDNGPSHSAVVAQLTVPVGTQWDAVFNCQGNAVRGPDFSALGIMVNQDGQTGTEATDTATIPADQKGHTKPVGGGH